jgi:hypothetical protein
MATDQNGKSNGSEGKPSASDFMSAVSPLMLETKAQTGKMEEIHNVLNDIKGHTTQELSSLKELVGAVQDIVSILRSGQRRDANDKGSFSGEKKTNKAIEELVSTKSKKKDCICIESFSSKAEKQLVEIFGRIFKPGGAGTKVAGIGGGGVTGGGKTGFAGEMSGAINPLMTALPKIASIAGGAISVITGIMMKGFSMMNSGLKALDIDFFGMLSGLLFDELLTRSNITQMIATTTGHADNYKKIMEDVYHVEDGIARTGLMNLDIVKLREKTMSKGLLIQGKQDQLFKKSSEEREKILERQIKRVNQLSMNIGNTAFMIGASVDATNEMFQGWRVHLGMSNIQLSGMANSMVMLAQSSGIYGDNLINAMKSSEQVLQNFQKSGTLTQKAAQNVQKMIVTGEKYGVGEEFGKMMGSASGLKGFLEADFGTRNQMLAVLQTISKNSDHNFNDLRDAYMSGTLMSIDGIQDQISKNFGPMLTGAVKEFASEKELAKLGIDVNKLDMTNLDSMMRTLTHIGAGKGPEADIAKQQLKQLALIEKKFGVEIGTLAKMAKASADAQGSNADKLANLDKRIEDAHNNPKSPPEFIENLKLERAQLMAQDQFSRVAELTQKLVDSEVEGIKISDELKNQIEQQRKELDIKGWSEAMKTISGDDFDKIMEKNLKTQGFHDVQHLSEAFQKGGEEANQAMMAMEAVQQEVLKSDKAKQDPITELREFVKKIAQDIRDLVGHWIPSIENMIKWIVNAMKKIYSYLEPYVEIKAGLDIMTTGKSKAEAARDTLEKAAMENEKKLAGKEELIQGWGNIKSQIEDEVAKSLGYSNAREAAMKPGFTEGVNKLIEERGVRKQVDAWNAIQLSKENLEKTKDGHESVKAGKGKSTWTGALMKGFYSAAALGFGGELDPEGNFSAVAENIDTSTMLQTKAAKALEAALEEEKKNPSAKLMGSGLFSEDQAKNAIDSARQATGIESGLFREGAAAEAIEEGDRQSIMRNLGVREINSDISRAINTINGGGGTSGVSSNLMDYRDQIKGQVSTSGGGSAETQRLVEMAKMMNPQLAAAASNSSGSEVNLKDVIDFLAKIENNTRETNGSVVIGAEGENVPSQFTPSSVRNNSISWSRGYLDFQKEPEAFFGLSANNGRGGQA